MKTPLTIPAVVRCMARRQGDVWEVFALEFDIAVSGPSFEKTHKQLVAAVVDYVHYVETLPLEEQHALLNRKAPFGLRLQFTLSMLLVTTVYPMAAEVSRMIGRGPSKKIPDSIPTLIPAPGH